MPPEEKTRRSKPSTRDLKRETAKRQSCGTRSDLKSRGAICAFRGRRLTVMGHTGQQVPDLGGNGLPQATEQIVSLQLSLPPASQVHVVQLFGCQVEPSGCVAFRRSVHVARQRQICDIGARTSTPGQYHLIFTLSLQGGYLRGSRVCSSCSRSCISFDSREAAGNRRWTVYTRRTCSRSRPSGDPARSGGCT